MQHIAQQMVTGNPKQSFTIPQITQAPPMPTSFASWKSALAAPHRSGGVFFTATDWLSGSAMPLQKPYTIPDRLNTASRTGVPSRTVPQATSMANATRPHASAKGRILMGAKRSMKAPDFSRTRIILTADRV